MIKYTFVLVDNPDPYSGVAPAEPKEYRLPDLGSWRPLPGEAVSLDLVDLKGTFYITRTNWYIAPGVEISCTLVGYRTSTDIQSPLEMARVG